MIEQLVRKNILALQPYSSARDEFAGEAQVYLDANENPNENGLNRYPDSQHRELRTAIAKQAGVEPNELMLGNGSDEIIDLLIRCFCEPAQDEIIILPPTYGMYSVCANINNVRVLEIKLKEGFALPVEQIIAAQKKNTKLLFICSPNNPTGNQMPINDIEELLQKFNGIVVVDEAYIEFAEKSAVSLLNNYENLLVMRTFSKARAMAGIRLGLAFSNKKLISFLNKIKPPYNVSSLTQKAALESLKDINALKSSVQQIVKQREWLVKELKELSIVTKVYPSNANFLLVKFTNYATEIYEQLVEKGVVVRNRSNLPLCENCLRITVGTEKENKKLITELNFISSQKREA